MTSHIRGWKMQKPVDLHQQTCLLKKFNSGDTEVSSAVTGTIQSRKRPLHKENTAGETGILLTSEYIFPHKSEKEAIEILRCYGTVEDVSGDGSLWLPCHHVAAA